MSTKEQLQQIESTGTEYLNEYLPLLQSEVAGNALSTWIVALAITIAALLLFLLARRSSDRIASFLKRSRSTELFGEFISIISGTSFLVLLLTAACIGLTIPDLPKKLSSLPTYSLISIAVLQFALWVSAFARIAVQRAFMAARGDDPSVRTAQGVFVFLARLTVWTGALLVLLDTLGVDITALIAGLGVGGVAVALAVQNILGDMFSSLSIILDRPFEVGDFIIVDEYMGEVERIGIKTTRIKSLSGEQIICANTDLLSSRIRNYKRMDERRVSFTVGVTYQTEKEKLRSLAESFKKIIDSQNETRFDRAHLKSFGASSIDFEIVYYVLSNDYNMYMDIQQAINLEIVGLFAEEGIDFAYPTRSLFIVNEQHAGTREDNAENDVA